MSQNSDSWKDFEDLVKGWDLECNGLCYVIWKRSPTKYMFAVYKSGKFNIHEASATDLQTTLTNIFGSAVPYIGVQVMQSQSSTDKEIIVRNVAVPAQLRRKGIATEMLAEVVEYFKPEKIEIESPGEDSIPWWDTITKKYSTSQIEVVPISGDCRKQEAKAQKMWQESLKNKHSENKK